jgi:TonB family protein
MTFLERLRRASIACVIGSVACLLSVPSFATVKDRETALVDPKCPPPEYPKGALRWDQEGTVKLELLIGADGKVRESAVQSSSLYPALDNAAQEGVHRCEFLPKVVNGKAVESHLQYRYKWSLEGSVTGRLNLPPPVSTFEAAPPALRTFLTEARKADTIVGPLRRCLAYPDLPGNMWRSGLAQSYCQLLLADAMTLHQVAAMVDRGALTELEALFRRDLALHFSKDKFSEIIHRHFHAFDDSDEAARVTSLWVEKAPESPFANAARGAHLHALAGRVRGTKVMLETPRENVNRMTDIVAVGYRFVSKAVRLEPRLISAHVTAIQLAMLDGDSDLLEEAVEHARALDPACRYVAMSRMAAISPRWGGSVDAMYAYAAELEPLVAARPLVAIPQVYPQYDLSTYTLDAKQYDRGIALLAPAALKAPYPNLLEMLGRHRAYGGSDHWETLVILLEASRFSNDDFFAARERGRILVHIGERDWALKSLKLAVSLKPQDTYASYLLGSLYADLREFELAVPYLMKGLADKDAHRRSLYLLYRMATVQGQIDKADEYSAQYANEFPQDVDSWYARAYVKRTQGKESEAVDAYKKYLALNDDSNPLMKKGRVVAQRYIDGERDPVKGAPQPR